MWVLTVTIHYRTIFGIWPHNDKTNPFSASGRSLLAAGYILYSASTELVVAIKTFNSKNNNEDITVNGFTMIDDGKYYLSRKNIQCPTMGPYYSLNEAREPDWPTGLQQWIHDAKRGLLPHNKVTKYSSRYVCSLVADVHRTLLKGGWAGNPRPHLRLLYEAIPMAFLLEGSNGKGSNGEMNLLDIVPTNNNKLHERVCCFLGSEEDIRSLEYYGNVQQDSTTYKA